jgi:hypothetical protein
VLICIPSRSRAERLSKGLITQIPGEWLDRVRVFVPESQRREYVMHLPGCVEVVPQPDRVRIAEKRHRMGYYAWQSLHESFFMVDDDVQFLVRRSAEDWRLQEASMDSVADMLDLVQCILEDSAEVVSPFSHVGISAREGNNRAGVGDITLSDRNTRCYRAVAWRTEEFLKLEHCRVPLMEDFDVSLQSLEQGRQNLCLSYWAQGQRVTNESGGCSDWRTLEMHNAAAHELAALHPQFVSLRQKINRSGVREGLSERTEVTIQWKRAAGR